MKAFHTFAVCAYKDSPYLEACLRSVTGQSLPTRTILCTSTPSLYIERLAERYAIPLYVREGESKIREDWNFAYQMAESDFVTIAHQDDLYGRDYVKTLVAYARRYPDMSLFTTDHMTVREHQLVPGERLWLVKKLLRLPLKAHGLAHLTFVKKAALRFGNPICCPACTYRKQEAREQAGQPFFRSDFRFALDWDHLIDMAEEPGRFICVEKPLMFHRLHKDAATNACMKDHVRSREELQVFRRLWPEPVVAFLMRFYQKAYASYDVG
ncbi:MAG: glycosyltransferase [Lachnospiraceae bacterium]|nr:glycosyltransferase [Lachnospiraceae bacterium]